MGGRASKTKPNGAAQPSRRGSFQTVVVLVDGKRECVDEMRSTIDGDHMLSSDGDDEARGDGGENAAKVSKVQEILEGKVELKKHQQTLEHLPHVATNVAALELQFSSSEDSDDGAGKRKRKGAKKKTKKHKASSPTKAAPSSGSAAPSPVKLKLNDLKVPKKALPLGTKQQQQQQPVQNHFEQISDAYALAEYTAKDTDASRNDLRPVQPLSPSPQQQNSAQQLPSPPKPQEKQSSRSYSPFKSKQQPSPGSSPTKFFANAYDNWKKGSGNSARSDRSQIMETRDPSRSSPPKSGNHSVQSIQSARSSRDSSRLQHFKRESTDLELDELDTLGSFSTLSAAHGQAKIADSRAPTETTEPSTRSRSDRRSLRIDDTDESIMDDILAEVVT